MSGFQPVRLEDLQESACSSPGSTAGGEENVSMPELHPVVLESDDPAERGYLEGFRSGVQEAESQTSGLILALSKAVNEFQSFQQGAQRDLENQAALLACELACALADQALDLNPEAVQGVIRGALSELSQAESVVVFVNPQDLDLLGADELSATGQHLILKPDTSLQRGDCRVESAIGDIDATRQGRHTQLREKVNQLVRQRETS